MEIDVSCHKKRVLHLLDSAGIYGAENVVINLSREMLKCDDYEPVVGCIVQSGCEKVALCDIAPQYGIEAHTICINNLTLLKDLPRLGRQLKDLQVDLVHSHGYKASVFAFIAKLYSGIPVMATCHLWFEGGGCPLKKRFMIALEKIFYRFFPVVVGVSENIRQVLINVGIQEEQIRVVKNGIVLSDYRPLAPVVKEKLLAELDLGSGDVCVLNVGRLTVQKGQDVIVRAAGLLKEKMGTKIKFFIVGDGELRNSLQDQIDAYDLSDSVRLLGFRDDIPALLQVADIFILPSLDEGMPMALLEAVASRVPVVTTAVGDIPKLVIDKVSGTVVEKNDASGLATVIDRINNNRTGQQAMVDEAWHRLQQNYSSSVMFLQYYTIYQ